MNDFNLRLYSKKSKEYVYINLISYEDGEISYLDIIDPCIGLYDIEISVNELGKNYILERCTGIKDKNGVLIYDNDIVKVNEWYGEDTAQVKYIKFSTCYKLINKHNNCLMSLFTSDEMRIIGNIHQNKDLLGE